MSSRSYLKDTAISAVFVLMALVAGGDKPADAQSQPSTRSVEDVIAPYVDDTGTVIEQVSTRGYDLSNPDGQARMMQRIERAVRRVCRIDDRGTLSESAAYDACHDTSRADAAAQLQILAARAGGGQIRVASADNP